MQAASLAAADGRALAWGAGGGTCAAPGLESACSTMVHRGSGGLISRVFRPPPLEGVPWLARSPRDWHSRRFGPAGVFGGSPSRAWVPGIGRLGVRASEHAEALVVPRAPQMAPERLAAARLPPRQAAGIGRRLRASRAIVVASLPEIRDFTIEGVLPRDQRRTACNGGQSSHWHTRCKKHAGNPELPSSPASQEPSRPVTASQSRADSRLLQPCSVRA